MNVFFYKILILNKTKNKNVCCFQIITNLTNNDPPYATAKTNLLKVLRSI